MIRLGNSIEPARAVCAPFICGGFDPLIEPMATARMLLLHTDKPGWVTTSDARQVKYLAELAALATAAILTDAALHQLFRFKYGMVLNVEPAYLEAKCPGIQAAFLKTFRQMAFSAMASSPLPIGLLDNGSGFSPVQAMIDLDVSRAMYGLGRGFTIDDETLCVDLINRMQFCERESYIEASHTLEHSRETMWDTKFFDRSYRKNGSYTTADAEWRTLVAAEVPPGRDARFIADIDRIVASAKKELIDGR